MKLEVGESLFVSWLKHVKECEVVQLNWKPSMKAWNFENEDELEELKKYAQQYFRENHNLNLFGKNNKLNQIVKQAELDALGIQLSNGQLQEVYAIDVAFHENGLSYGSVEETVCKVTQKIIRAVICLRGYFGVKEGTIIFASPKIGKSILNRMNPVLDGIKHLLTNLEYRFNIEFVGNDRFENEILQPVIKASDNVADTSELFMRSIQMLKMFYQLESSVPKELVFEDTFDLDDDTPNLKVLNEEMRVGELAQSGFNYLFANNFLSDEEIQLLSQKDYSKHVFNVNYPVLREIDPKQPVTLQLKGEEQKYNRYYVSTYSKNNKIYALTSQWFKNSKTKLDEWLKSKGVQFD